jgi:DnaJ-class molecular chaperone
MKVVVRCEDCVGYGYVESKNMSSALTIDCGACDGSGEYRLRHLR